MNGSGPGRHLPGPGVAADQVHRDDEPDGRHPAEVRRARSAQIIDPILTAEERKELDRIADRARRGRAAAAETARRPTRACRQHERTMKERFAEIDRQASELNVEIQSLEAQLVAIENYYRVVARRAEDPARGHPASPCATCAATIEELRGAARQAARGDRRRAPRRDRRRAASARPSARRPRSCRDSLQRELEIQTPRDGAPDAAAIACRSNG